MVITVTATNIAFVFDKQIGLKFFPSYSLCWSSLVGLTESLKSAVVVTRCKVLWALAVDGTVEEVVDENAFASDPARVTIMTSF